MGYYILQRPTSGSTERETGFLPAALARWRAELENGLAHERRAALRRLVEARAESVLVQCLAVADATVVQLAASGLWECWLGEAGDEGRREIGVGIEFLSEGSLEKAAGAFRELRERYPRWPEAANKLATVLYLQGQPEASIELCREVVARKPDHFGAWNGLALCAVQIEDWLLAHQAARESLRLQPYSPSNRQLLHLIESRLPPA